MKKCGLLGEKLSHSYSPQIHKLLCNYEYTLIEKSPDSVETFLRTREFDGINVTIPYKKTVVPFCDTLSDIAKKLGSVNTIVKMPDSSLFGHNTDYYGFSYMIKRSGIEIRGKKAVVLGDGGASVTVCAVLEDMGAASIAVISLFGEITYDKIDRYYDADIIVNATPVGMYPNNGESLVNLENFKNCCGVFDLVYNPARTKFLLDAERLGIPHSNGLSMLVAQAKESAEYFSGEKLADEKIDEITLRLSTDMKNIILIGMPGCGKSTVGKLLAKRLGRRFIDADQYIVEREKMPIPEIFEKFGEDGFRKRETEALAEICKNSSCIIATGGGCVTRSENYPILHQNGSIVWILRDIETLPTDGRPLSIGANLSEMYEKRKPLYESFADFKLDNNLKDDGIVDEITRCIYENSGN